MLHCVLCSLPQLDNNMLERYNLPTTGPLFKSESGELSNLRWDLPASEMPSYYSRPNRKQFSGDWALLEGLTKGLAGGGPGSRCVRGFVICNSKAVVTQRKCRCDSGCGRQHLRCAPYPLAANGDICQRVDLIRLASKTEEAEAVLVSHTMHSSCMSHTWRIIG